MKPTTTFLAPAPHAQGRLPVAQPTSPSRIAGHSEISEESSLSCKTRQRNPIVQDMGLQKFYATIADMPIAASVFSHFVPREIHHGSGNTSSSMVGYELSVLLAVGVVDANVLYLVATLLAGRSRFGEQDLDRKPIIVRSW